MGTHRFTGGQAIDGLEPCKRQAYWGFMYTIAALYHFTRFDNPAQIQPGLLKFAQDEGISGTLLLAGEGINGTIAGTRAGIDAILSYIRALPGCDNLSWKESSAKEQPFARIKVRIKKEIVTMGVEGVDPNASVGSYVAPEDWNDLISQDDVVVIDTRNDYEVDIGTFEGAIDPKTKTFREFPAWWENNKERFHNKKVAMFCTGGIRCEKSTNFLIGQGVEDVYHLHGGILQYLEDVPEKDSMWNGSCFVFDGRVSVEHGLAEGPHELCHACRRPIVAEDKSRPEFEDGVSCHQCLSEFDEDRRNRFRERQKQMALSKARGEHHLGREA
jgi:UPF0176 protein